MVFVGCFLVIDLVLSSLLGAGYERLHSGPGRFNYFKQRQNDCLIMGSSTAKAYYEDIFAERLGMSVLNVSLDGSSLLYSVCLLKYVIHHQVKPKLIILNVDLFEVLDSAWGGDYYANVEKMRPLYGEVDDIDRMLEKESWGSKVKFWAQSYKYNNIAASIVLKQFGADEYTRGVPSSQILELPLSEKIIKSKFSDNSKYDQRKIKLYEYVIELCRANNIKLLLVESPVYYPGGEMIKRDKRSEATISALAVKHQIPFLIFSQERYPMFKSNLLFEDVLHLNFEGGRHFSELVSDRIKQLL